MLLRPDDIIEGQRDAYTVVRMLSQGAFGAVHLARDTAGAWRVLKQLSPAESLPAAELAYQRECLVREASFLTRHRSPWVVQGYEAINRGSEYYLVLEYIQGQTLEALYNAHLASSMAGWAWPTVAALASQIAKALAWLHALPPRWVFADLKPANVMWDAVAQRCRLIDFGTLRSSNLPLGTAPALGTTGYAAPELYDGSPVTQAADLYSIGAMMLEFLSGVPPAAWRPGRHALLSSDIPYELRRLVGELLQSGSGARSASAADVWATCDAIAGSSEVLGLCAPSSVYPASSTRCPRCGRRPTTQGAVFCGHDGALLEAWMLAVAPRFSLPTTLYLPRDTMTVGRHDPTGQWYPELDLTVFDPTRSISRHQVVLRFTIEGLTVEVLPSRNGTRLDGSLLAPGTRVGLAPGARLEIGEVHLTVLRQPVLPSAEDRLTEAA